MRLAFLKDLVGNELLAQDIVTSSGKVLLKSGVQLNDDIKKKIERQGIFFMYVEDEDLSDVDNDKELFTLKKNILEVLPNIFEDLSKNDKESIVQSIYVVDDLINYMESEKFININLYEVKMYDDYTYIHSVDTAMMAIYLGIQMKLDKRRLRDLGVAALFHDIGKTKIPNEIINKPARLTDAEFNVIKKHPMYGKEILMKYKSFNKDIINSVAAHHEKYNGKGYPLGLKGDEIPLYAKVISVCDVFTAITADRCYRKRFAPKEAYELILSETYTSFDPDVVDLFRDTFAVYPLGCPVKLSDGRKGFVIRQNEGFPDRPIIRIVNDRLGSRVNSYEINLKDIINVTIESI